MSNEIKLAVSWANDKNDLLFTPLGQNPETCYFYHIPREDLLALGGLNRWINHLSEKCWFTKELEADVIKLAKEAVE